MQSHKIVSEKAFIIDVQLDSNCASEQDFCRIVIVLYISVVYLELHQTSMMDYSFGDS